jgi:transposase
MDDYQLSETAINKLKRQHRQAKTKFEADRLKALYLLGEGWEPKIVAHILDKDLRTILSYFQHYKDGGSDQLLQNNYNGKEPKLSPEQEAELAEHLRKSIYSRCVQIE